MGSFTVSVRGVSLDSCIEARAVPVRSCGVWMRFGAKALFFFSHENKNFAEFLSRVFFHRFISGSLFGGAIRAEDIAGWGV